MYGYTLLVTMNQRLLKKLSKGRNIDGLKRSSIYTIYYTHLAYVVLQHSVYDGSLMTTYITPLPYIILFILCSLLNSLLHWYQLWVTVHHVPKCMSFYKAFMLITYKVLFSWLRVYKIHLASVKFDHSKEHALVLNQFIKIFLFLKNLCVHCPFFMNLFVFNMDTNLCLFWIILFHVRCCFKLTVVALFTYIHCINLYTFISVNYMMIQLIYHI